MINISKNLNKVNPSKFYVYTHSRMTDGLIMYVGKGSGNRAWQVSGRNSLWVRTAKKHGVNVSIHMENMSESCALVLESIMVAVYKSKCQPLTNLTSGGDGAISSYISKETIDKIRLSNSKFSVRCSNGMVFDSARAAARWLRSNGNPKASGSQVSHSCRSKRGSCYGFSWWVDGESPVEYVSSGRSHEISLGKKVCCSNGMLFDSAKSAERWLRLNGNEKASSSAISRCCNLLNSSAYGYKWSFVDLA